MLKNTNCITIVITLEGTENTKTEKENDRKTVKIIYFTNAVRKR